MNAQTGAPEQRLASQNEPAVEQDQEGDSTRLILHAIESRDRVTQRGLAESREQALDRMVEQAVSEGANAVVCLRFSTSMVMGGAAELLAYGTAVVLEARQ